MTTDSDSPSSPDDGSADAVIGAEWDKVRSAFQTSIMVNTALNSLAQNLDIEDWPVAGAEETPAKYLPLDYAGLVAMPELAGHPQRVKQLISILRETLAFDQPFGEMVTESAETADRDNPLLKSLARLGIPESFPLSLVALLPETRDYCNLENLVTLRDFALFAQNLSQTVVVSGDFRSFLNALSHIDEASVAIYLPFRPGAKGLHLLEGVALAVRAQADDVQAALAQQYGARLSTDDLAAATHASHLEITAIEQMLMQQATAYVEYFQEDLANLQQQLDEGVPLSRIASALKNPILETIVTNLLKPYLKQLPPTAPTRRTASPMEGDVVVKKTGFFAALGRLFKK